MSHFETIHRTRQYMSHPGQELVQVQCPFCWEFFEILVDGSIDAQDYIEDCEVCCRPIDFSISVSSTGAIDVQTN